MISKADRQQIAQETISFYDDLKKRFSDKLGTTSILYTPTQTIEHASNNAAIPAPVPVPEIVTEIEVYTTDTLFCAGKMVAAQLNPLVLNFASERKAGGGWINGALAQEECLFYRSTYGLSMDPLFNTQAKSFYPIPPNACIYSPNVLVIRDVNYNVYEYEDCYTVSFVAAAAIRHPILTSVGTLNDKDTKHTKEKMRLIYDIALKHGHDSLLLGAWGSGVFENPPKHMAELFQSTLNESAYKNRFKKVAFAVLGSKDDKNVKAYREVFAKK